MARNFLNRKPKTNMDFGIIVGVGLLMVEGIKYAFNKVKTGGIPIPGMSSLHTVVEKTETKVNPE